jgi:hypothetical protein
MKGATVAFLSQPVQIMAQEGEAFSAQVLRTLKAWAASKGKDHVRAEFEKKLFVLSPGSDSDLGIVVLSHGDADHFGWTGVCALEFGEPDRMVSQFAPLAVAERMSFVVEVRLDKVAPSLFTALVHAFGQVIPVRRHGVAAPNLDQIHLLAKGDVAGRRWVSSQARSHFRTLLEDARKQPQIIERGDDDVVVVSRNYLRELMEPTSARSIARRFRARALSAEGLADAPLRTIEPLEDLPELVTR